MGLLPADGTRDGLLFGSLTRRTWGVRNAEPVGVLTDQPPGHNTRKSRRHANSCWRRAREVIYARRPCSLGAVPGSTIGPRAVLRLGLCPPRLSRWPRGI